MYNEAFMSSALERGSILFIVRGNLECSHTFEFLPFGILIHPPTYRLEYIGRNSENAVSRVFINELQDEKFFYGEILLPHKTREGVAQALVMLEIWADLLCIALGNPKITVEPQLPVYAIAEAKREIDFKKLEEFESAVESFFMFDSDKRSKIDRALWWYRKACATAYYSDFDSYTAYWNCLEILCDVSGDRVNKGKDVDQKVRDYLRNFDPKKLKAGHINECYHRFVRLSIKNQMKDALVRDDMVGTSLAEKWIKHCFEIQPSELQLYKIRNDINHGNIRENSFQESVRVKRRLILLQALIMTLLYKQFGKPVLIPDPDELWQAIKKLPDEN